jgi:type IV fimbrial biogenesis protein FimT
MKSRQTGLTLVELMVTLAAAIILLAVGMPLFTGVAANNRAVAQANTFVGGFKLARSEAVKRATEVSVCAVDDPDADPVTCGSNSDWGNGLMVFTDGGTTGTVDGGDERIKVFANPVAGATVSTTVAFVRYQARGETATPTTLELGQGDTTGNQTRCLFLTASGQTRLERAACP